MVCCKSPKGLQWNTRNPSPLHHMMRMYFQEGDFSGFWQRLYMQRAETLIAFTKYTYTSQTLQSSMVFIK